MSGEVPPAAGVVELIPVGEPGEGPYGIAATDDGAVWVTLVHGAAVCRRDPDGTLSRLDLGAGAQPSVVAAANGSDVWVSDTTGGRLLLLGPGPRILAEAVVPTPGAQPFGVASVYDGTTWFTELAADALGRIGVLGRVEEFPVGREDVLPSMITASGDSLWFTMNAIDALGHIRGGDAAVAITELPAGSAPVGITVAEDGAVWAALIGADALARVGRDGTLTLHPLGAGAKPHAVAADATGGVWASLWGADALSHVTASGETTRVPLPPASEPHAITVAPDATIWAALESGALAHLHP